jgi:fermentation-respiration switch protein FrsA (DUF1100 family)
MSFFAWLVIFSLVVSLLFIIFILISRFAFNHAFYFPLSRPVMPFDAKNDEEREILKGLCATERLLKSQSFEPVYMKSFDGLSLFGRYYQGKADAPLFIEFHGYKGDALRDLCAEDMVFKSLGASTLIVDQRAHGKSDGTTISFGIKERFDCLSWVRWANERFGKTIPIFLAGISMGASSVLMASCLDLPKNVYGIIADCAYSSPKEIIRKVCRDIGLPPRLTYPFISAGAYIFGKFNLNKISPKQAVAKSKTPIIIMHGEADCFVPCKMSNEIYDSCASEKYLFTFFGAGHGFSFATDAEKYDKAVRDFVKCQLEKHA